MKVTPQYRKNRRSITPGGVTVVVEYADGQIHEYDHIKNPDAYIRSLTKEYKRAWVKGDNEVIPDPNVIATL